jgi:MOSC domain-containing protein YiiM/ribosomal protein S18 acetylase RimI-like enzyme
MQRGRLLQVNVSAGGVPKLPVQGARVTALGVEGDRQANVTTHGGPYRAVSLLGIEAIRRVAAEGNPIAPGTTGENLTTEGFDVSTLPLGTRLAIGDEVVIELTAAVTPCRTIRHSFDGHRFARLNVATHPDDSRMYARVLHEGTVRPGDPIVVSPPVGDAAEQRAVARRLDRAERASTLALWTAAVAAGHGVHVVDDGELAIAAAPDLPGAPFNLGFGFVAMPHLLGRARDHFAAHGVTGWAWTDAPPWPGAEPDATAAYGAAEPEALTEEEPPGGIVIRRLARDEVGPWGAIVAEAGGMGGPTSRAFAELEAPLAGEPHHHRFVAELDGRPVGTGSLHTHHQVGWLRAGVVLPEARGRGIQRALIRERAAHAARLGCDLIGASANAGGVSARNLELVGARIVAVRGRYRIEPSAPLP